MEPKQWSKNRCPKKKGIGDGRTGGAALVPLISGRQVGVDQIRSLGSSTSRIESPNKLKANTERVMASPG